MRVIGGKARGRRLAAPRGKGTRPTPDRVREALFSILGADVPGARVLDLFAGTGALGIEALSRGASGATFVEQDRRVVEVLRQNLKVLMLKNGSGKPLAEVLVLPVERGVGSLARAGEAFDLVFADPPFEAGVLGSTLDALAKHNLVRAGGLVICEHGGKDEPPAAPPGLSLVETRAYGDVALSFFRNGATDDGPADANDEQ